MNEIAKERRERERTKEREEERKLSHHNARGAWKICDQVDEYFVMNYSSQDGKPMDLSNPMGPNPRKRPEAWDSKQVDFFLAAKYKVMEKHLPITIEQIKEWVIFIWERDYAFRDGTEINKRNFIRSLRAFCKLYPIYQLQEQKCKIAQNKQAAEQAKEAAHKTPSQLADEKRRENAASAKFTNDDWQLCFEECRNCIEKNGVRLCAAGCAIPANKRPRPMPPRECAQYTPRTTGAAAQ